MTNAKDYDPKVASDEKWDLRVSDAQLKSQVTKELEEPYDWWS